MLKSLSSVAIFIFALTACQNKVQSQDIKNSEIQTVGLISGSYQPGQPGVVELTGDAQCTGALVGLNPPTVITARHCVEMGATDLADSSPQAIVVAEFEDFSYDMSTGTTPGDIAVLIYPKELAAELPAKTSDIFSVAPVTLQWQSPISICGYGASNFSATHPTDYGSKRCGSSLLITDNKNFTFSAFLNIAFKSKIHDFGYSHFSETDKIKFIHGSVQLYLKAYGEDTRYGIAHFTGDAFQENPTKGLDQNNKYALINRGDSGGPWFIQKEGENPHLFAVSSMALADNSVNNNVVADVAWRLDHPWSVALMAKAIAQEGADITGFTTLQKSVKQPAPEQKK